MLEGFPQSKSHPIRMMAASGALLISFSLFLLIPLTQILENSNQEIVTYRSMALSLPPPPPPPTFDEPPEADNQSIVDEMPVTPEINQTINDIPTPQLALSLAPGIGVPLMMGLPSMPMIQPVDVISDIERIFNFDELVQVPTLLNGHMIRAEFPRELLKRGIQEATVQLEILIDTSGRVKVGRILSLTYDHPKLIAAAKKAATQARFSITEMDGRPVTVRGHFPITLQAPR